MNFDTLKKPAFIVMLALIIVGGAFAIARLYGRFSVNQAPAETVSALEVRVERAAQAALDAEAKAVEARPGVEAARAKVRTINTGAGVRDRGQGKAALIPAPDADPSPVVINTNFSNWTMPEARAEIENLVELVTLLDAQVTLEIQRGDAWKAAFEADQELIEALKKEVKKERVLTRIVGAAGVALAVILIVVLL